MMISCTSELPFGCQPWTFDDHLDSDACEDGGIIDEPVSAMEDLSIYSFSEVLFFRNYLAHHPTVARKQESFIVNAHLESRGWKENWDPSAGFDTHELLGFAARINFDNVVKARGVREFSTSLQWQALAVSNMRSEDLPHGIKTSRTGILYKYVTQTRGS